MVRIEAFLAGWHGLPGRPPCERAACWRRAFIAKAVELNIPTTSLLIEMLSADKTLRRLCGWQRAGEVPSEFGRFRGLLAEFAASAFAIAVARGAASKTHPLGSFGRTYLIVTARRSRPGKNRRKSDKPAPAPKPKLKRGRPRKEVPPPAAAAESGSNANGA